MTRTDNTVQRFQRDPQPSTASTEELARFFDERVSVIERHFPPSVAQAYAIPKLGADGALEWWTGQQGGVRPFSSLTDDQQKALLARHAEHQAQLTNLVQALEERGMRAQADLVRGLKTTPDPERMYSVEGRLLLTRWVLVQPQPLTPVEPPSPEPSRRRWIWISLLSLLCIALLLALLWWFLWRTVPAAPPELPALPVAAPAPEPAPAEPEAKKWPTEVAIVLDTSAAMGQAPGRDFVSRWAFTRGEIEKIASVLPAETVTHVVRGGSCSSPTRLGPYDASRRDEMLAAVAKSKIAGPASLAASLKVAAAAFDGTSRDALLIVFGAAQDGCGADVCAVAQELHREKPRLRINLIDVTGNDRIGPCMSDLTGGEAYHWGVRDSRRPGVDLAEETSRQLKP